MSTIMNELIKTLLEESGFYKNPFFTALRDGNFDKEDFTETQIQFYFAVVFFNRPMAALAAKIPTTTLRMEILRNLWEEHGEGDETQTHHETFSEFLRRLANISPADVDKRALWPEVRAFNTALMGCCVLDEPLTGVGIMGVIERMFAEISAWIGQAMVEQGWLTSSSLIHYSLHQELDMKHAQDFFNILARSWDKSPRDQYAIEQGLRLGVYIFNRLYEDLYRGRNKRLFRTIKGSHSRYTS